MEVEVQRLHLDRDFVFRELSLSAEVISLVFSVGESRPGGLQLDLLTRRLSQKQRPRPQPPEWKVQNFRNNKQKDKQTKKQVKTDLTH